MLSLIKGYVDVIYSEIDLTLSSLETLAKVFDHPSCSLTHSKAQVQCKEPVLCGPRTAAWHLVALILCNFCRVFLDTGPRDGDGQLVV